MKRAALPLLAVLALAVPAAANVEPHITVETVEPTPAEPGDTVALHIAVENTGSEEATFDPVSVETVDGISVIGTTDTIGDRFTLCSECRQVGTVRVRVADDLASGTYPVKLRLTRGDTGVVTTATVEVDGEPTLAVDVQRVVMAPGANRTMRVSVTNTGTGGASAVTATLDADQFGMYPTTLDFGRIEAGETVTRTAMLEADPDTASGLVAATLDISGRDETTAFSTDSTFKVRVLERADLVLSDVSVDATVDRLSTVTVELENLGPGEAEQIVAELSCDGAAVRAGTDFVGQLDETESVPVTFRLVPQRPDVSCTVSASYRDSRPRSVSSSFEVAAERSRPVWPMVVAALVVVVGAVLAWRRRRGDVATV